MRPVYALLLAIALAAPAAAQTARVDQFAWLAGCWSFETPDGRYEEQWSKPTGNNIIGTSRRVADGFTREFEFLRIVTSGGGGFDYIALPQGEGETRFNMLSMQGGKVIFENPAHDFPTRIIYEFVPPDALHARIEGNSDGRPLAQNFPMQRRSCP